MKLEQLGEGVIPEFAHTVDRVANGGIPVGDLLVNPLGVYLFIYLLATILFVVMIKASWDQFWASWLIKEKSVAAVTVYVFIGKFGCFLGWLLLAIQGAFMTVYCAVGIARPNQVDPILIKSELPSEDELGAFGVEGTQNAEKDGDG